MSDTKLQVLSFLAQQEEPFRAVKIQDAFGISRQLVRHHLKHLQDEGLVDQQGIFWFVPDRNKLIEQFAKASLSGKVKQDLLEETKLLDDKSVKYFNSVMQVYIALKSMHYPNYIAVKADLLEYIDETIEVLQRARKYLNSGVQTENAAKKALKAMTVDWRETFYGKFAKASGLSPEEFMAWFKENVDKDTEDVD